MIKRSHAAGTVPDAACTVHPDEIEKMWSSIASRMERVDMESAKENVWLRERNGRRQQVFFLFACGDFFDVQLNNSQMICFADEK